MDASASWDPRITPLRDGIASRALEGLVRAEVYLDCKSLTCTAPAAGIHRAPDLASEQMDQLLFGEAFDAIEEEGGFLWGQARRDGYVGFAPTAALAAPGPEATHRVAAVRTYAFAEPSIKSRASGPYSMNALVAVEATEGRLAKVVGAGWMAAEHLTPIGTFESDIAGVAERFLGAPYLWGGRESLGLDCSGLVQAAMFACGLACPRDADQQAELGREIGQADFGRGDLVFWKGHVGIGLDRPSAKGGRIVHANGFHMAVAIEPLEAAIVRIDAAGAGQPTGFRRL
ncbi:NlpC/P60 family protein [Phenylobacterium sp.]|uniref:C40 family peptidase n=1 Tax=Phenylobacterium sp. TaxID=1871053 RepID=UPI001214F697|nr:NlpC/P60 family protein [Phenylobacterium sp.]THD62858.1 MAG: peptidoglycan endopeptidase [Phenylobacterium sp.]